ncbi:hypothetical protein H3T12_19160 [Streptomyces sp. GMR22]|nr:hypothetical protein [Streptomyces sp. GMR22]
MNGEYIEAHGTGIIVGDPIEVTALGEMFTAHGVTPESRSLIGSVKGNIGHMGPAAGVDPRSVQRAADLADRPGACRVPMRGALSASCGIPAVRLNRAACALAGCCRPLAANRGLWPGSRRPCQSPPVSSGRLAVRTRRRNL